MDLRNTQCPFCKHSSLTSQVEQLDGEQIYTDAITCGHCSKTYDLIWGVPYLGTFKQQEIISLLEIAANAAQYQVKGKNVDNGYLNIINMVDEYTNSSNKPAVLSKYGFTSKPYWLDYRYSEHIFFKTLTQAIDLKDKHVLDIGAGSGYDSLKFHRAGAKVTCLEFNSALSAVGRVGSQQLRWFGGSSDNLPFADCQFDIVAANAALHHLADIPQSLQESLRVLKPGGYLITLGDSFMGDSSTEEQEALIFNHHTSVLQGVNEQVPKFQLFVETFKRYKDALDIRVFTQNLQGLMPYHSEWSFEEAITKFSELIGNIHFLVQKKQPISIPQSCISQEAIRPSEYAKELYSPGSGINRLIDLIPDQFVNLSVTDHNQPKFRLLNGWKLQQVGENKRTAYKRARLFFSLDQLKNFLRLSLLIPYVSDYNSPTINIKFNSIDIFSEALVRGVWHELCLPVPTEVYTHKNFLIEIQLQSHNSLDIAQEFYVRDLVFLQEPRQFDSFELDQFGLETLVLTVLKDKNPIAVLMSPDFEHSMDVINRLQKWECNLQLVVPKGQEAFYSWISKCKVVETYPNFISDPVSIRSYQIQHPVQLIAAANSEFTEVLQNISQHVEPRYIIQAGGNAQLNTAGQLDTADQSPLQTTSEQGILENEADKSLEQAQERQFKPERLRNQIKRLQDKTERLQHKVAYLRAELQEAKTEIASMKTSKFWKMRNRWFEFRGLIQNSQK